MFQERAAFESSMLDLFFFFYLLVPAILGE